MSQHWGRVLRRLHTRCLGPMTWSCPGERVLARRCNPDAFSALLAALRPPFTLSLGRRSQVEQVCHAIRAAVDVR
jgi:hypothetical protein